MKGERVMDDNMKFMGLPIGIGIIIGIVVGAVMGAVSLSALALRSASSLERRSVRWFEQRTSRRDDTTRT
jgi:gas vesicle protein